MGGAVARRGKHSDVAVPPFALLNMCCNFLSGILELGKNSSFFIRCIHGISEKIQKSSEIRHNQRRVGRNENIITELHP